MDQISAESILSAKLTSRLDFPMISLKDDQVDRRKMEAWQHVQSKRTNRDIDFLRPQVRFPSGKWAWRAIDWLLVLIASNPFVICNSDPKEH